MNGTNSLNKILAIFKSYSRRAQMINDFGFGTTDNIGASRELKYPFMWVYLSSCEYTDNGLSEIYHFEISFLDKIMFGENNYAEVLSDMQYAYRQFYGEIFRHPYWNELELQLVTSRINSNTVYLAHDMNVQGWTMNLWIKEPVRITYCNSPINPIEDDTTGLEGIDYWIVEDDFIVQ